MTVLHITNGDHAGDTIRACGIGGDVLPWRDPMHHGPFPPDSDLDAVSAIRSLYLSGEPDAFRARDAMLRSAGLYDEVVLWFEHDLLDQLQILQLLDWFFHAGTGNAALTMICVGRFPGIEPFRGLGQLNTAQMASLWPTRRPVTAEAMVLAVSVWAAFRSPDPGTLLACLFHDLTALPFLRPALARHCEEFPWTADGLTRTERQILTVVAGGESRPGRVFAANMALETVLFEGDLRTFQHIAALCGGLEPLLTCAPHGRFRMPVEPDMTADEFRAQRLTVTDTGQRVLAGTDHASAFMHRDLWLGGVHVTSAGPMWCWDPAAARFVRTD